MKILYYDCFAGISGAMNLGAMIDIGVSSVFLSEELKKINQQGYELCVSREQHRGIAGTRVEVVLAGQNRQYGECLNLAEVETIIRRSSLSDRVKSMSLNIFGIIAQAQAQIQGMKLEEVLFREKEFIKSIVEIVGAAICIEYIAADRIISSPVEMGGGFVNCVHGLYPVPAPVTLEIMKGIPMKSGAAAFEMATPVGVAILAALVDEFSQKQSFTVIRTGYGTGNRDAEFPNVLRVCVAETEETSEKQEKTVDAVVIECNIDDMNPERYAFVMERLFEAGADDVYMQNIIMKKSRPAVMLSVLCAPERKDELERIVFTETTTLGTRCRHVKKTVLERRNLTVETPWGAVRVKEAYFQGQKLRAKPEYDDCANIARKHDINIEKVYAFFNKCDF